MVLTTGIGRNGGAAVYQSSPIKRHRRTKREVEVIREAMHDLLAEENPMTVRQVFYRLVSMRVIDKTEAEYQTVVRLLGDDATRRRDPVFLDCRRNQVDAKATDAWVA